MTAPSRSPRRIAGINGVELVAGALIAALGITVVLVAPSFGLGSMMRVGAGALPFLIGVALIAVGIAVAIEGRSMKTTVPPLPWRPVLSISAGIGAFALLIEPAGIYVATVALIVCSGFAERQLRPATLALIALALCLFVAFLIWVFGGALVLPRLPFLGAA